jgi:hypothetical protein
MVRCVSVSLVALLLAACSALPERSGERHMATGPAAPQSTPATVQPLPAASNAAAGQCMARLGQLGADYSAVPDRYVDQGCAILGTVQLASLPSDNAHLGVTNLGPVTCEVGQVFAAWARFGVDRAARQILGSGLRSIETFGSYSCRNVAGTSRRSGHATGEAIDVSGFVLEDGRRITVKSMWSEGSESEREFLRVVQRSACKRFATVLGPDYNVAHRDHLHVEGVIGSSSYCR